MIKSAKRGAQGFTASLARIVLIFLLLSIGLDSLTRMYYSYMPVDHWMDFRSVNVGQVEGEAMAIIDRKPYSPAVSIFHRTLLIRYPQERRGCTNTTITIVEDNGVDKIMVPLSRMLASSCPDVLTGKVDAVLQVSYIFEFPYGVKRFAVRYSNRFSLSWDGRYIVGPPTYTEAEIGSLALSE